MGLALAFLSLQACHNGNSANDVWSNYDYLEPVSADSGLAVSAPERYLPRNPQTQDNDDTYVLPSDTSLCGSNYNLLGCE
jgi:hypothetical protein